MARLGGECRAPQALQLTTRIEAGRHGYGDVRMSRREDRQHCSPLLGGTLAAACPPDLCGPCGHNTQPRKTRESRSCSWRCPPRRLRRVSRLPKMMQPHALAADCDCNQSGASLLNSGVLPPPCKPASSNNCSLSSSRPATWICFAGRTTI